MLSLASFRPAVIQEPFVTQASTSGDRSRAWSTGRYARERHSEWNFVGPAMLNNLANLLVKRGDLSADTAQLTELLHQGIENPDRKARVEQNLIALRRALTEGDQPV